MRKISIITSGIFIAISVFIFFMARTFPAGTNGALGPGFFPMALACIVTLLSAIQIYNSSVRPSEAEQQPADLLSKQSIRVWVSLGVLILYFIVMQLVGFILATPIFLFVMLIYFQVKNWVARIAVPLCTTAAVYFIFTTLLLVQLPAGKLF
ncbi:MAG: tripartite tricarboxylate transporter TctB family protein [Anaerotruncus sp.]|nr:tripartite tricarboxylate transporter TctB family protein [Anaerotruncus sp.]